MIHFSEGAGPLVISLKSLECTTVTVLCIAFSYVALDFNTIPISLSHHMTSQHTHTQSHVQPLMTLWNSVSVAFQTVRSCLAKIVFECRILNIKTSKHNDSKHTAVVWANLTRIWQHSIQWVNGRFFIHNEEIKKVMAWFARTAWFGENNLKLFPSL